MHPVEDCTYFGRLTMYSSSIVHSTLPYSTLLYSTLLYSTTALHRPQTRSIPSPSPIPPSHPISTSQPPPPPPNQHCDLTVPDAGCQILTARHVTSRYRFVILYKSRGQSLEYTDSYTHTHTYIYIYACMHARHACKP